MDIISSIRKQLKAAADPKVAAIHRRFFKEKVKYYGLRSAAVRNISLTAWKEAKLHSKNEIFQMCEELYRSGYNEESFIASDWLPRISDEFAEEDLKLFEKWTNRYIDNWAKCDTFCNHTVGAFLFRFPECITGVIKWAGSKNLWVRRASAVSLIIPGKRGKFLKEIFVIADLLLLDGEDMVQKGYGWMLKEASRLHQKEVFEYVLKRRKTMPRTALRYAIELMPPKLKKTAMQKPWEGI